MTDQEKYNDLLSDIETTKKPRKWQFATEQPESGSAFQKAATDIAGRAYQAGYEQGFADSSEQKQFVSELSATGANGVELHWGDIIATIAGSFVGEIIGFAVCKGTETVICKDLIHESPEDVKAITASHCRLFDKDDPRDALRELGFINGFIRSGGYLSRRDGTNIAYRLKEIKRCLSVNTDPPDEAHLSECE